MRVISRGMAGFLSVLVAAGAAVLSSGAAFATPPDFVEMEVLGVVVLESEAASVLILRQKGAQVVLPIFVGRSEGLAIEQRLKGSSSPHPQTSDLLAKAIAALGGKVTKVEIQGIHAALFRARVSLEQGDKRLELEGRPSDTVALALRERAPIFASKEVMAEAGLTPADLERMRPPRDGEEKAKLGAERSF